MLDSLVLIAQRSVPAGTPPGRKKAIQIASLLVCIIVGVGAAWLVGKTLSGRQGSAKLSSADAIFARNSPAVVQIVIQDRQGINIGDGSGFLVSKNGLIATNCHVIEKAHTAHVVFADKTKLSVAGVAAMDADADIAIIKIVGEVGARPLQLAGHDLPAVGTKVYAIGNPLGLTNTLSDGLVSGHQTNDRVTKILTTAPISPGSSGGPLLAADGKVVGVTTASFRDGQNLNIAVPASHVATLLVQCENQAKLTKFPMRAEFGGEVAGGKDTVTPGGAKTHQDNARASYERGFAWMKKGEFDKAIKELDEAVRLDPTEPHFYLIRGYSWSEKKGHLKAIDDYNKAVRLDPNNAVALASRGASWTHIRNFARAIEDCDAAIRLDPTCTLAHTTRDYALTCLQIEALDQQRGAPALPSPSAPPAGKKHKTDGADGIGSERRFFAMADRAKCDLKIRVKSHEGYIYNGTNNLTITRVVLVIRTARWTRELALNVHIRPLTTETFHLNLGDRNLVIQGWEMQSISGIPSN